MSAEHAATQHVCELLRIHELLLQDGIRNRAFHRALEATVNPESVVLDIGSGSGLWAISAAKLGARRVVAVEMEPVLAGLIEAIARDCGVVDRIEVVIGDSRRLALSREFDVVISETIGHMVFDERIVEIMIDARQRFLRPGGVLIPDTVTLYAAGACLDTDAHLPAELPYRFSRLEALKMHNPLALVDKKSLAPLTSAVVLVHADLKHVDALPPLGDLVARWPRSDVTQINCFAVWAEMTLGPENALSTLDTPSWSVTAYRVRPFVERQGDLEFRLALSAHTNQWTVTLTNEADREVQSYSPEMAALELFALNAPDPDVLEKVRRLGLLSLSEGCSGLIDGSLRLRPVEPGDVAFLKRVYFSTREEELAIVPWNESEKRAFLEMQFRAQDTDYRANYPDAAYDVILRDGVSVGRLYVHRRAAEIAILDIAVLPDHRGMGIGTALLGELSSESDRSGKPLVIHVEKMNRAKALYDRLGFVEAGESEIYWRMMRPARST